ncbi:MAG: hypothetical protein RDV48_14440 [Candidatus Eremiobacteraeota bacterium]|nr:hypothetical protein [Candidatus Eremiobacteraeota bacterium]
MKRILLSFLFSLLLPGAASAQFGYDNFDAQLDYRQRGSYIVNGQRQTVLMDQFWGSVVFMPERMGAAKVKTGFDEALVESGAGTVKVYRPSLNVLAVTYPGGEMRIEEQADGGTVTCGGQRYSVKIEGPQKMTVEVPGDVITYSTSIDEVTVSGKRGSVTYRKLPEGYSVKSAAGTTTYKAQLNGGFTLEGVPLQQHPYGYWGCEFYLTRYQVGVIVEFNRLISFPALPRQITFDEAIVVNF